MSGTTLLPGWVASSGEYKFSYVMTGIGIDGRQALAGAPTISARDSRPAAQCGQHRSQIAGERSHFCRGYAGDPDKVNCGLRYARVLMR